MHSAKVVCIGTVRKTYVPMRPKTTDPKRLGETIRGLRDAQGLSRPDLAVMVDPESPPHRNTIAGWEKGTINITDENLERVADALGVPLGLLDAARGSGVSTQEVERAFWEIAGIVQRVIRAREGGEADLEMVEDTDEPEKGTA